LHAALNVNQSAVNLARESAVAEEIKLFSYLIWPNAFVAPPRITIFPPKPGDRAGDGGMGRGGAGRGGAAAE